MNEIQNKIIVLMHERSKKGKARIAPVDLGRILKISPRKLKSECSSLVALQELAYWSSGSCNYLMLKKDFDLQKSIDELSC
jgi:hypothetical protein